MLETIVAIGSRDVNQSYTIGELAKQTGVKVVTIRYYEQIGILPVPARSPCNYRVYSHEHVRHFTSFDVVVTWASPLTKSGRCYDSPPKTHRPALRFARLRPIILKISKRK
jgi:MerR family regulatory protein